MADLQVLHLEPIQTNGVVYVIRREKPARVLWCHICHPTPPTGGLQALQQLEAYLPDYEHFLCSFVDLENGNFNASFKLRMREEQQLDRWLDDFQTLSKTTWRVEKSHPKFHDPKVKRTRTKFRLDLKCQLSGARTTYSYKKQACPARMSLVLKKQTENIAQNRRAKPIDPHIRDRLEFHVNLRNSHNHGLEESLRHRDVSKETMDRLVQLFELGHRPSTALKVLKAELRERSGDGEEVAVWDRAVEPDLFYCYRLFYKLYPHKKVPKPINRKPQRKRKIKTEPESEFVPHDNVLVLPSSGPTQVPVPVLHEEIQTSVQNLIQSQVQESVQVQVQESAQVQEVVQVQVQEAVQVQVQETVQVQESVQELVENRAQSSILSPVLVENPGQKSIQKLVIFPVQNQVQNPILIQSPGQKLVLKSVTYPIQKPIQKPTRKAVQKPVKFVSLGQASSLEKRLQSRTETDVRLGQMFRALSEKLKTNAEIFEDPIKSMLCCFESMDSDLDLVSALNKFGKRQTPGTSSRAPKRPRLQDHVE